MVLVQLLACFADVFVSVYPLADPRFLKPPGLPPMENE